MTLQNPGFDLAWRIVDYREECGKQTLQVPFMPRPKLHSDEAILDAARQVLLRRGPAGFTLSDVATAVGISRAALIQRFQDKTTLHRKVMERMTQEVRDYFAERPVEKGLDPLWDML
jgi:AcrR family transcriptional regulator